VRPRSLIECIATINRETYNRVTIRLAYTIPNEQLSTANKKRARSPAHDNEPRKKPRPYVRPGERGTSKCEDSDDDFILFMGLHGVVSDQIGLRLSKMNTNHIPFDAEALAADIDRRFEAILDDPAARADAERRMNKILSMADPEWHVRLQHAQRATNAERSVKDLPVSYLPDDLARYVCTSRADVSDVSFPDRQMLTRRSRRTDLSERGC
jgi:hypothetical protein